VRVAEESVLHEHPDAADAVLRHLAALERTWSRGMTHEDLGRGAGAIYELLIEHPSATAANRDPLLHQAWRSVGAAGEPTLLAKDYGEADRAWAPLGRPLEVVSVPSPPNEQWDGSFRPIPLGRFLKGTCVIVNGTKVSRRELIAWSAITLSSKVHYAPDFERAMADRREPFPQLFEIGRALLTSADVGTLRELLRSRG
jgi:hypothetical protein